jgi:hypothetical protein
MGELCSEAFAQRGNKIETAPISFCLPSFLPDGVGRDGAETESTFRH